MRPRILILVAIAGMFICTWANEATSAQGEPGVRARGDTFSVPVPKGFSLFKDERFLRSAPGGIVLVADKRAAPHQFLGSIVVVKMGPSPDFDPSYPPFCKQMADASAAQTVTALKAHRIVKTSAGNTCQWELVDKEVPTTGCIGTVMYKTRNNGWVVTCNFDTRDTQARAACGEVLAGWTFD